MKKKPHRVARLAALLDHTPIKQLVEEVKDSLIMCTSMPLYRHWLYTGFMMPDAEDLPEGCGFPSLQAMLLQKQAAYNKMARSGDTGAITFLTERPFRLEKFLQWDNADIWLRPSQRIATLRAVWTDCEGPHANEFIWRTLWRSLVCERKYEEALYTSDELAARDELPELVSLWRGVTSLPEHAGLSWTSSVDTGKWFARRWANQQGGKPYLLNCKIHRDLVLGPFLSRGEYEYVLPHAPLNHSYKELNHG